MSSGIGAIWAAMFLLGGGRKSRVGGPIAHIFSFHILKNTIVLMMHASLGTCSQAIGNSGISAKYSLYCYT